MRAVVEAAVESAVRRTGRALGPGPQARDAAHAQRVADLEIYVRQSHAERDLATLGELAGRPGPPAVSAPSLKGDGTPEDVWWAPGGLDTIPARDPAAVRPPGRVVVVAPHPDDEVLGVGGTLAAWAPRSRCSSSP